MDSVLEPVTRRSLRQHSHPNSSSKLEYLARASDSSLPKRSEVRKTKTKERDKKRAAGFVTVIGATGTLFSTAALPASAVSETPVNNTDELSGQLIQTLRVDGKESKKAPEEKYGVVRARVGVGRSSSSGPSVPELLSNAPYPNYDLSAVYQVASRYVGVPYVFGGASPSGFDCSGLIQYVFAHFGIALPHSVSGQAAMGRRIPVSEALPGDMIVMPGHNGFYAGNGMILHAPDVGRTVTIAPIWTSSYYVVRIGI